MGKGAPKIQPVDPVATANAQSASNIATAQEQQRLNMVGSTSPQGTVNYVADSSQPGGYRQVTTLSPQEQATYNAQKQAENGALDTANTQLGRVNQALATPLDTNGLPDLRGAVKRGDIQSTFNQGQALQYGYDPGQQVQGHIGPQDLNSAYQAAANASYGQAASRLDPQYAIQQNQLQTQLANQGLSQNDDAYKTAMDTFNRGKTDAYNQANFSAQNMGLNAENTLFGQSLNQGQFANQAAAQEYAQNQGQAAFHNQTANQDYTQNQGAAQFANQAQNQDFQQRVANAQLQNTARQQGLQERSFIQNTPINQFTGLLGLGQVGTPQGISYTPSQVAPTDVLGAYALNQQGQLANAQMRQQANSGLMGGLMSLGSAAIMASDRRLKTDIEPVGTLTKGVRLYRYRYRSGGPVQVGVMAQELRRLRPDLVVRRPDGYLAVNYAGLARDFTVAGGASTENASRRKASGLERRSPC